MTFNNIEALITTSDALKHIIYDGEELSIFHDGVNRHVIIKSLNTSVTVPEQGASLSNQAYIIASTNTSLYITNPNLKQIKKLEVIGSNYSEDIIYINNFNKYKNVSIVGTNNTQNNFIPLSGGIKEKTVVVSGHLQNVSPGLTVGGFSIPNNAICYMYSSNGGGSFSGPWFPFIVDDVFLTGNIISCLELNGNWYFYIKDQTTNYGLMLVQTLGVDLIGDWINNHPLGTTTANIYQLPLTALANNIYFPDPERTFLYNLNIETGITTVENTIPNINNLSRSGNNILITNDDNCSTGTITPSASTGENILTQFAFGGVVYNIEVLPGRVLIEDNSGPSNTSNVIGGEFNSNHYIQPAEAIIN